MLAEPTDLAYLAGVVDADGYVTATRSRHAGRLYFGAQIGTFTARFSGWCPDCSERIHPGDQVHYTRMGGHLVHDECPELRQLAPGRNETACSACGLTHAGDGF